MKRPQLDSHFHGNDEVMQQVISMRRALADLLSNIICPNDVLVGL